MVRSTINLKSMRQLRRLTELDIKDIGDVAYCHVSGFFKEEIKMKVFISQPMSGRSDKEVLKEREEIKNCLESKFKEPIKIIDSFTKSPDIVKGGRISMLGHSISLMCDADLVVFAPYWTSARGCRVEYTVACEYELKKYYVYKGIVEGNLFSSEFKLD